MKIDIIDIQNKRNLCVVESERDVFFTIKRVYCVFGEKEGTHRGCHAHKKIWEVCYCPHGKISILLDDGKEKTEVMLDNPSKGLIMPPHYWRETFWHQDDSVLCVMSSDYYDESEYLHNYNEFLNHKFE